MPEKVRLALKKEETEQLGETVKTLLEKMARAGLPIDLNGYFDSPEHILAGLFELVTTHQDKLGSDVSKDDCACAGPCYNTCVGGCKGGCEKTCDGACLSICSGDCAVFSVYKAV